MLAYRKFSRQDFSRTSHMKNPRFFSKKHIRESTAVFLSLTLLTTASWFLGAREVTGGTLTCQVCHNRTRTLTYDCLSIDYQKHLDHGDPMGACGGTPTAGR